MAEKPSETLEEALARFGLPVPPAGKKRPNTEVAGRPPQRQTSDFYNRSGTPASKARNNAIMGEREE